MDNIIQFKSIGERLPIKPDLQTLEELMADLEDCCDKIHGNVHELLVTI